MLNSAGVAQSAEQLICNQQVAGSSPITSSSKSRKASGSPVGAQAEAIPRASTKTDCNGPVFVFLKWRGSRVAKGNRL